MKILPNEYLSNNRRRKPVKKIEHPTLKQLTWLFLPCFLALGYGIIKKSFPMWIIWVEIGSSLTFLGAATYFCVKQKCYTQLSGTYVNVLMLIGFLVAQGYTSRMLEKYDNHQKEMTVKQSDSPTPPVQTVPTN